MTEPQKNAMRSERHLKRPVRQQEFECMVHWFANGECVVNCWDEYTVRAVRKAEHGDWKTQCVKGEFMGLGEGEEAELIEVWTNFYGKWCRVRRSDGKQCDIAPKDLELVLPNAY